MIKLRSRKEADLFVMLEAQANVATRSALKFRALVDDFANIRQYNTEILALEHEGDELTHDLQNRIAATFITPLDKEDLKQLSQALDDVTDFVEAASARAELYRITSARPELIELADTLVHITDLTEQSVKELKDGFAKSKRLRELLKDIHTAENQSDTIFRQALMNLFDEPNADALTVMKWKELFDRIETAVDKCEDIAAIIGTILIKYA